MPNAIVHITIRNGDEEEVKADIMLVFTSLSVYRWNISTNRNFDKSGASRGSKKFFFNLCLTNMYKDEQSFIVRQKIIVRGMLVLKAMISSRTGEKISEISEEAHFTTE
jgi:hypothetical protein